LSSGRLQCPRRAIWSTVPRRCSGPWPLWPSAVVPALILVPHRDQGHRRRQHRRHGRHGHGGRGFGRDSQHSSRRAADRSAGVIARPDAGVAQRHRRPGRQRQPGRAGTAGLAGAPAGGGRPPATTDGPARPPGQTSATTTRATHRQRTVIPLRPGAPCKHLRTRREGESSQKPQLAAIHRAIVTAQRVEAPRRRAITSNPSAPGAEHATLGAVADGLGSRPGVAGHERAGQGRHTTTSNTGRHP